MKSPTCIDVAFGAVPSCSLHACSRDCGNDMRRELQEFECLLKTNYESVRVSCRFNPVPDEYAILEGETMVPEYIHHGT